MKKMEIYQYQAKSGFQIHHPIMIMKYEMKRDKNSVSDRLPGSRLVRLMWFIGVA